MLIDVHCHLDFKQFDKDRKEVIEEAEKEGILMITSALGPKSMEKTLRMREEFENKIFATFGSKPEELNQERVEETIQLIRKNKDKILGIGEVGLDYYWVKEEEKREQQKENFLKFISLAQELKLPLVVHSRDAEREVIEILKREKMRALMHCFSGSLEEAKEALSFGCLISIPTNVIYSKQKRKLAKEIPLENIVLETDAPFLAPLPRTRNKPLHIKISAKKIAEIKGMEVKEVEKKTTKNALDFFRLKL